MKERQTHKSTEAVGLDELANHSKEAASDGVHLPNLPSAAELAQQVRTTRGQEQLSQVLSGLGVEAPITEEKNVPTD